MRVLALVFGGVLAASSSCARGDALVVTDAFADPDELRGTDPPESIHTYASNARVPWQVRSIDAFTDVADVEIIASEGLSIDEDPAVTNEGGVLSASILTGDAGTGTIIFKKKGTDDILASRDITVADVDDLTVDITAPDTEGLDLPELDIARVRIASGRSASFRINLFADGQPVYGLEAVDAIASDDDVTTAQRTGCAEKGCTSSSMATQISVADGLVDNDVDVVLSAGTASLTMTIVPTDIEEVTELVIDAPTDLGIEEGDESGVVALVRVGNEPLFGAPVTWTIDAVAVEGSGDAARFKFVDGADAPMVATLGDRTATVRVPSESSQVEISSITSACTQTGGAPWYAAFGAALLLLRRRRR